MRTSVKWVIGEDGYGREILEKDMQDMIDLLEKEKRLRMQNN